MWPYLVSVLGPPHKKAKLEEGKKRFGRGVNPLSYFPFQPVFHDWCNKGRGMCYVGGMMHIKEPLLLIGKISLCGGSRFPLLLSMWSFRSHCTKSSDCQVRVNVTKVK